MIFFILITCLFDSGYCEKKLAVDHTDIILDPNSILLQVSCI